MNKTRQKTENSKNYVNFIGMAKRTEAAQNRIRTKLRSASATNTGRYHIVQSTDGWAVKKEGAKRASKIYRTKSEAIRDVKSYPDYKGVLILHRRDGSFSKH